MHFFHSQLSLVIVADPCIFEISSQPRKKKKKEKVKSKISIYFYKYLVFISQLSIPLYTQEKRLLIRDQRFLPAVDFSS